MEYSSQIQTRSNRGRFNKYNYGLKKHTKLQLKFNLRHLS